MKEKLDFRAEVREMAKRAKEASHQLARLSTDAKNRALLEMADDLERKSVDRGKSEGSGHWGEGPSSSSDDGTIEIDLCCH
jgi:hypothetical protein